MGWLDLLQGSVVGFDTMPLIYYIEENSNYSNVVDPFFEAIERSEFRVVTSIVTLLKVLVHPIRNGDAILAQEYRDLLFNTEDLSTMEVDQGIAEEAARLRASYNIRTPDSIQMATAISVGASFFLTNDTRLPSLPNLKTLVLDELKKGSEG
jgi:predicted nucleic acid-binding protein